MNDSAGVTLYFRWRSMEVTRIEGFSDAAFAFAITFNMGIATASIVLAWARHLELAGWIYCLLGPIHGIHGWRPMTAAARLAGKESG